MLIEEIMKRDVITLITYQIRLKMRLKLCWKTKFDISQLLQMTRSVVGIVTDRDLKEALFLNYV